MKKKRLAVAVVTATIALSATFTGCNLVSTYSRADMEQTVATVDITKSELFKKSELSAYAEAITSTSVSKRDLVSLFLNYGYSSINGGSTYKDTINNLMDMLVENEVLIQYSVTALLDDMVKNGKTNALSEYKAKSTLVEKYEYLLGGKDSDDVKLATYKLYSSINAAIDSYEKTMIEDKEEYEGTATRTTPTNLNTEQDDYYPKTTDGGLDYNIYTGYEGYLIGQSGAYEDDAIEGTTSATRIKAYNTFIYRLYQNNLVDVQAEAANLKNIKELNYIENEYVSQLESRVINKYYDIYEEAQKQELMANDNKYLKEVYDELVNDQTDKYKTASAFESAMGSMSSTSFLLYSPDTTDSAETKEDAGKFGFVYNILLPFSAKQNAELSKLKSILGEDDDETYYYNERNQILKEIKTEDQRTAWFNGTNDYSFKADKEVVYNGDKAGYYDANNSVRNYLFFEDNLTNSAEDGGRYKKLQTYDGRYSYNGSVYENDDGSYTLVSNKLDINGMLDEFESYINYVLGGDNKVKFDDKYYTPDGGDKGYYNKKETFAKGGEGEDKDDIDYSKFLYAFGQVELDKFSRADLMNTKTEQYKVMSAVNELQFAYTTDTGVLSQYIGYSVSAYETSFIKEFEYAAQTAIKNGEGSFAVCAGDYGWHLVYVTYTFGYGGDTYSPVWSKDNIETEGTFENLFLEWLKDKTLSNVSMTHRSQIISNYNKDSVVEKFQKTYQDLLDLDED